MEQSMRRFMKVGITFHVSYPQLGGDGEPILECLEWICGDDYSKAVEVVRVEDGQVREKVVEVIRAAHTVSVYGGQPKALSAGLDINNLDETRRAMVVDTLKKGVDEAYEIGCVGFSLLCDRHDGGREEQASEQFLKSTRQLYGYTGEKGNMPICCEVFDYDIDKGALTDSATLAACYAGETRKDCGNFSLLAGLSHIPILHETTEENILPVKDYVIHAYVGNTVVKSLDCETYGDNHPRLGSPSSEDDVEELAYYLRTPTEIGLLGEKKRSIVGFKVKPWKDESPKAIIANTKRTLNLV